MEQYQMYDNNMSEVNNAHTIMNPMYSSPSELGYLNGYAGGTAVLPQLQSHNFYNNYGTSTGFSQPQNNINSSYIPQNAEIVPELHQVPLFQTPSASSDQHITAAIATNPNVVPMPQCDQCGKQFKKVCYLRQHYNAKHTKKRNYKCAICGKFYETVDDLQTHMNNHRNKQHQCERCPRSYRHKADLKRHEMLHSNQFKHYCPYCKKGINRLDQMEKHIKSHVNREIRKVQFLIK